MVLVVKNLPANAGDIRCGLNPWVGKVPWRRKWQPNSSILVWEIPWTEKPDRLQSIGLQRVGYDWRNLAHMCAANKIVGMALIFSSGWLRHSCWKRPWCWEDWRQEEKWMTEDEMVEWHHPLNGHEFEQTPGDGDGQGGLVCCSPWCCKESDMTERLNNNKKLLPSQTLQRPFSQIIKQPQGNGAWDE